MAEQQEKLKKLFNARSNIESELRNVHKDITDAIDRQDMRVKVERLVSKLKVVFSTLVEKNEEIFDLASKAENTDSIYFVLEQWLDDVTNNNDKLWLEAILTQLLIKKSYARALTFKGSLREDHDEQRHQGVANVNITFSWQN